MRYSPEHKQQTRDRILKAAFRRFRRDGFERTSVASIMQEAELTHGGFYAHFTNKDALIAEVLRIGFESTSERFEARHAHLGEVEWVRAWVRGYLSDVHRDHPGEGCPLPALMTDISRAGPATRAALTDAFERWLDRLRPRILAPVEEAERRILAAVAQMSGALALSRALDGRLSSAVRDAAAREAEATLLGEHQTDD